MRCLVSVSHLVQIIRVDLRFHSVLVSVQRVALRYWGVLVLVILLAQIIEVSWCLFQGRTWHIVVYWCLFQGRLDISRCIGLGLKSILKHLSLVSRTRFFNYRPSLVPSFKLGQVGQDDFCKIGVFCRVKEVGLAFKLLTAHCGGWGV